MRHVKRYRRLSRNSAHRRSMLRNLATSFFIHGSIRTTQTRAKELQPIVEQLITAAIKGKNGDLNQYRKWKNYLHPVPKDTELRVMKLIQNLETAAPGGWTRVVKLQRRAGDGSWMARILFVTKNLPKIDPKDVEQKKDKDDSDRKKQLSASDQGVDAAKPQINLEDKLDTASVSSLSPDQSGEATEETIATKEDVIATVSEQQELADHDAVTDTNQVPEKDKGDKDLKQDKATSAVEALEVPTVKNKQKKSFLSWFKKK